MKLWAITFALRCLSLFPLPVSRAIGRFLGWCWWQSGTRGPRVTLENIRRCFPELDEQAQRTLARQSLEETGRMAMETPAVWYGSNDWRAGKISCWREEALLDQGLASGQGLIVLIPHLGNWEMAGMVVSARRPCTILYREPRMVALNDLLCRLRNVGTTRLVPATGKGVLAVLKTLKEGGMTIILPDQEPATQGGIFSPFFGVPAYSMTLVHRLQQKTGARILFAYALPERSGFSMHCHAPEAAIYSENEQESVGAMNRIIESMVRNAPRQYQWEYKRFRKRPPGEARFYQFR